MHHTNLHKPYKLLPNKWKRYIAHYDIPADRCVVIPLRELGEDILCEVRWRNDGGDVEVRERLMFNHQAFEPIDPFKDDSLYDLWKNSQHEAEVLKG